MRGEVGQLRPTCCELSEEEIARILFEYGEERGLAALPGASSKGDQKESRWKVPAI